MSTAIARERREVSKCTGITPESVVTELAKLGFSDIWKAISWRPNVTETGKEDEDGVPTTRVTNEVSLRNSDDIDDATTAITEISQTKDGALKVKLADKRAALVDVGRHLGMFRPDLRHPTSLGRRSRGRRASRPAMKVGTVCCSDGLVLRLPKLGGAHQDGALAPAQPAARSS
ncbi:hypothetical protein FHR71_005478 [Methylobacterium sp. RAS18]|nr:hypothetical protein [Methylobacterium sp. RAS18]